MPDFDDLQIRHDGEPPLTTPSTSSPWRVVLIIAILAAVAIAGYWFYARRSPSVTAPATTSAQPPPVEAPPPRAPLAAGEPVELPSLDSSDDAVRDLVEKISADPLVATWLSTSGLLRQVASSLQAIAGGQSPARRLQKLAPSEPFRAASSGGRLAIDPRSYARYDRVADAAASIDPAAAARLYGAVKPRLDEAIRDLGVQDVTTDEYVERAIRQLLQAPVLNDPPALVQEEGLYRFADPRLENLPAAQKQLIRMGPENTVRIQSALRAIAHALGIPDERLPQPRSQ